MNRAGPLLKVARDEFQRYFRSFNPRVAIFMVIAGGVGAFLLPALIDRGVVPDEDLYRAEVTPSSPLLPAFEAARRFEVFQGVGERFLAGEVDLLAQGTQLYYMDTERGRAAAIDFATHLERFWDEALTDEANQTAAFPVTVNVVYQARQISDLAQATQGPIPTASPGVVNESLILQQAGEQQLGLTPSTVEPPFPMRSLLLTFVFLIPLSFVGLYYAGSLLAERTRQRGVLLLSGPISGPAILAGKTLPYAVITVGYAAVATPLLGAGILAFLATLPITAFYLAATALASLVARSYRELTFFVTTMSVALSTYLFLPAIFTQVHPIAFISPVSVLAAEIRNEAVPLDAFLYSITPLTLAAMVLWIVSSRLYREEHLFAPRAIGSKVVDAVGGLVPGPSRLLMAGALVIPFVFGAELFVLAFAASLPARLVLGAFLIGVALVEELAKGFPAYAHYRRARNPRAAWVVGALVGLGFFLAEKLALLFSIVGLDLIPLGNALLASYGISAGAFLLFAPLVLHVGTATLTSFAASKGRLVFAVGIACSVVIHILYNWTVIRGVA